ncbi:tryptophan--tRNA ligase [Vulgatibacter sp.]|uniref:tryptophan--tRNA ligase n=1 Tax=Vulgatibacter sp. TaxID=1971226 RepID=UPI0035681E73
MEKKETLAKTRVLSGIQPSGKLHIGNYFGAIQQHIALQHEFPGEAFYFIANYHALTTLQGVPDEVRAHTLDAALDYLALGLDPKKATFYRQSDVPEVTELTWFLATVTPVSLLEKGVSYKDKIAKGIAANAGLLTYPVLMAADILIAHATLVPVGEDQIQHIEFTRDMAGFFNNTYGAGILTLPAARFAQGRKVPGTDGQKMSKSYGNTIGIFEEGASLKKKVMGIKTSSVPMGEPLDPETDTVFALYKLVASPGEIADMEQKYRTGAVGFGHAKKELLGKLEEHFAPARARRKELEQNLDQVEAILREGAERTRAEARKTLDTCRRAVGMA